MSIISKYFFIKNSGDNRLGFIRHEISFTAISSNGLIHKVNSFLQSHPDIELIDIKYAAILYR